MKSSVVLLQRLQVLERIGQRYGWWLPAAVQRPDRVAPSARGYSVACSYKSQVNGLARRTAGNAEVFALESVFTERASLLLEEAGCKQRAGRIGCCFEPDEAWVVARPRRPEWIAAAPRRRQHGQPRLRPSRAHRPQCCDQIIGQPRRLIGHDPAVHRQSADRIIAARQRQHPGAVVEFEPVDVDRSLSSAPTFNRLSRTRRTASALCRCAGQAITDNDRGVNTIACAMRPGRHRGLADLPRGQRQNGGAARRAQKVSPAKALGSICKTSRTHSTGSSR